MGMFKKFNMEQYNKIYVRYRYFEKIGWLTLIIIKIFKKRTIKIWLWSLNKCIRCRNGNTIIIK